MPVPASSSMKLSWSKIALKCWTQYGQLLEYETDFSNLSWNVHDSTAKNAKKKCCRIIIIIIIIIIISSSSSSSNSSSRRPFGGTVFFAIYIN